MAGISENRRFNPTQCRSKNIMLAGDFHAQINTFHIFVENLRDEADSLLFVLDYDGSLYERCGAGSVMADFKSCDSVVPDLIAPFVFSKNDSTASELSKQIAPCRTQIKPDRTSNDMFWSVSSSETIAQYIEYLLVLAQNAWLNSGGINIFREIATQHGFMHRYMYDIAYGKQNMTSSRAQNLVKHLSKISQTSGAPLQQGQQIIAGVEDLIFESDPEEITFGAESDNDSNADDKGMIKAMEFQPEPVEEGYPQSLILPDVFASMNKRERDSWNIYVLEHYAQICGIPALFNSTLNPASGNIGTVTPVNMLRTVHSFTESYFDLADRIAVVPSSIPDFNINEWLKSGTKPIFIIGAYTGRYCRALACLSIQALIHAAKRERRHVTLLVTASDHWEASEQMGNIRAQSEGYIDTIYGVCDINKAARKLGETPQAYFDDMHGCSDITIWHSSHNGVINEAFQKYVPLGRGRYQPKDLEGGLIAIEADGDVTYPIAEDISSNRNSAASRAPFKEEDAAGDNWFVSGVMTREGINGRDNDD